MLRAGLFASRPKRSQPREAVQEFWLHRQLHIRRHPRYPCWKNDPASGCLPGPSYLRGANQRILACVGSRIGHARTVRGNDTQTELAKDFIPNERWLEFLRPVNHENKAQDIHLACRIQHKLICDHQEVWLSLFKGVPYYLEVHFLMRLRYSI